MDISSVQQELAKSNIEGWLLFDFRRSNDLACHFLGISESEMLTRRFFYWIPREGEPVKIVHTIETQSLAFLPGRMMTYCSWQDLEEALGVILKNVACVAMEYSPRNAIPYVSKVDAGTLEIIRGYGVEVVSSADLLQRYTSVWDEKKLSSHLFAAEVLSRAVEHAWTFIAQNLGKVTEYDVQQFILKEFADNKCISQDPPLCAINAHSANPHYMPLKEKAHIINHGDFILIDLWCKQDAPDAVYADITRVGVAASQPTERQNEIFQIVKEARNTATQLVISRFAKKIPLKGCEVDLACRNVIEKAGYGAYFTHRTGHNIDTSDHGNGAHIDNLETQDHRSLLAGTCFSIEPGIYLPGEFGIRLEYDIYIHHTGKVEITGGIQNQITCLFAEEKIKIHV